MGANAMRGALTHSTLVFGLLAMLCASADAATIHQPKRRSFVASPSQTSPSQTSLGQSVRPPVGVAVPGWSVDDTLRWLDNKSAPGRNAG
jgi:hypothetical protein